MASMRSIANVDRSVHRNVHIGSVKHNEPAASTSFVFYLYHQDAVNTLNIVRNAVSPKFDYKYYQHTVKTMNIERHHIFQISPIIYYAIHNVDKYMITRDSIEKCSRIIARVAIIKRLTPFQPRS